MALNSSHQVVRYSSRSVVTHTRTQKIKGNKLFLCSADQVRLVRITESLPVAERIGCVVHVLRYFAGPGLVRDRRSIEHWQHYMAPAIHPRKGLAWGMAGSKACVGRFNIDRDINVTNKALSERPVTMRIIAQTRNFAKAQTYKAGHIPLGRKHFC